MRRTRTEAEVRQHLRDCPGTFSKAHDETNPKYYKAHPSGIECIQITEHLNFCLGNAIKYIWRAGMKGPALDDLRKARWYLDREIERLGNL
jgi:hypothetical protein